MKDLKPRSTLDNIVGWSSVALMLFFAYAVVDLVGWPNP